MGRRMVNGLVYVVRGALAIALFGVVVQMGVALFLRGGVGSSVPGFVRSYERAELENVMDEREVELVEACFSAPDSAGVRRFVGHPSQLKPGSALARAFERAAELQASCAAPSEAAQGQATASSGSGEALPVQAATSFVAGEYEAVGIDLSYVREGYLRAAGSQLAGYACLLALALLLPQRVHRAQALK